MSANSILQRYANGDIGPRISVADVSGLEARLSDVESGSTSATLPPVADLTALKAITAPNLTDKVMVLCETLGLYRLDTSSSATADDTDVVRPTAFAATNGRFIRISRLQDSAKANKAIPSVVGNVAILKTDGDLEDSEVGLADLTNKIDKIAGGTIGNIVLVAADGNVSDSGLAPSAVKQATNIYKAVGTGVNGAGDITLTTLNPNFTPTAGDKVIGAVGFVTSSGACLTPANQPVIVTHIARDLGVGGVATQLVAYGDQTLNYFVFDIVSMS